ncbi:MAG: Fic family protein [Candidatus Aminicenantes bacterium]|nr:Fic family protein [Candidatus Aminicenantes bacterium]
MMSFRGTRLQDTKLPLSTVWLLESMAESKGRQELFEKQSPQILKTLGELALIESTESSNRIEGVTVEKERLRPLVLGNTRPRDRSEEEILGYRLALKWIHTEHGKITVNPETCLRLHAIAQGGMSGDVGKWKTTPNDILEIYPDGRRAVRFKPLAPDLVPNAMEELCLGYRHAIDQLKVTPLMATACLILDFLCIHPFRDGNGRISRLLTLLALYHHGFDVGRYISHERIVEQTKEDYYEALKTSSTEWHEGKHDVQPWFNYLLTVLRLAYREFEDRAQRRRPARGSKTELVEYALRDISSPFGIADVERLCPNVSRDSIRLVMNRWRKEGRLEILGKGRDAKWRRTDNEKR